MDRSQKVGWLENRRRSYGSANRRENSLPIVEPLQETWVGLVVKSEKPHRFGKMPQKTVDRILKLRREKHWGQCKIEGYLRNYRSERARGCCSNRFVDVILSIRIEPQLHSVVCGLRPAVSFKWAKQLNVQRVAPLEAGSE